MDGSEAVEVESGRRASFSRPAVVPRPELGMVGMAHEVERSKLASLIVDLWDLLHLSTVGGQAATAAAVRRVRPALRSDDSAYRALDRASRWLAARGVRARIERAADGLPLRLDWDVGAAWDLLAPEVDLASAYLLEREERLAAEVRRLPRRGPPIPAWRRDAILRAVEATGRLGPAAEAAGVSYGTLKGWMRHGRAGREPYASLLAEVRGAVERRARAALEREGDADDGREGLE